MQRIYCVACGAHAFDYDGDIRADVITSAEATFPDGSKPGEGGAMVPPCGHLVRIPSRDLRVEELP